MAKLRDALPLALALFFLSLIGDPGACCAMAGDRGCQTAPPESTSGGGLSGLGILPGSGETAAPAGKADRLAAGLVEALRTPSARGFAAEAAAPSRPGPAASTPLYLSHCAFLC